MIPLINKDCIEQFITFDELFHGSYHGTNDFLGGGILHYAFPYMYKSKCCVCLGSGSGFVPRLMRQAQFDVGIFNESETILVDADMPEAGWGEPDYHKQETFFTKSFDVKIIKKTTKDALEDFVGKQIDHLHIDADHSYEWAKHDFFAYSELVPVHGIITLHDSMVQTGVPKLVEELQQLNSYEVCNIRIGTGVAIVRKLA